MPMGKGTYGSKRGRPKKKKTGTLKGRQNNLPAALKKAIGAKGPRGKNMKKSYGR
tara:strand:- start:2875 stop:3039 length:165 start_codon:yes stop_codon:yes gene_type:complete